MKSKKAQPSSTPADPRIAQIQEEIAIVLQKISDATPMPGVDVPFCPMIVRCQAPSRRGHCRRTATRVSRVSYRGHGERRARIHLHDTCWQHTTNMVVDRTPPKLRVVRGGK